MCINIYIYDYMILYVYNITVRSQSINFYPPWTQAVELGGCHVGANFDLKKGIVGAAHAMFVRLFQGLDMT